MEIRFTVQPGQYRLSRDLLESVQNDTLKIIKERFKVDPGSVAWLEAGGYVKWASGKAELEPQVRPNEIRIAEIAALGRLME
jgi:hypothetical protein